MIRPSNIKQATMAAAVICAAGPVWAQTFPTTPDDIAQFALDTCMMDTTENLSDQLAALSFDATQSGLTLRYSDDNTALFGLPDQVNLSLSTTIDSITCDLRLPPVVGTVDTYEVIQAAFTAAIAERADHYDNVIPSDASDPSPHIDGFSWTIYSTQRDIIVAMLVFGTEDGIRVFGNSRKNYE